MRPPGALNHLWWANAFVGPEAGGNPTAVVVEASPIDAAEAHRIARDLRAPDTVFIAPGRRAVRFFSPFEGAMSFCGQGLIAADAVLRRLGERGPIELETPSGPVTTVERGEVHAFLTPRDRVKLEATTARPFDMPGEPAIVDSGRRRWFLRTSDVDAIELEPAKVLELCRSRGLTGICPYEVEADRIRLRVFTISLAGREDVSTGGAVLGLAALVPPGRFTVDQGRGHALQRGRLFLAPGDPVEVGGAVALVARGELV